jgi:putative aldouronate transport system substrate-binding protein
MRKRHLNKENEMKKTRITMFVLAALVALCAGGCKGSEAAGVPELIWWQVGGAQSGFEEDMKTIAGYVQEKIGVRMDIKQAGWADAGQRFNTMINAGEYFDIMFVDQANYNRFVTLGAFADITDLLPAEAPELWRAVPSVLWDGVRVKQRVYSVPTYKDSSKTAFYFWDHAYVEKYSIDLNQTGFAYLDSVFRRIKDGEGARFYPLLLAKGSNFFLFDHYDDLTTGMQPLGVRLDDQEYRVVNTLEQPDIQEALRYLHSWYEAGIINPDANMVAENPKYRMFFIAQAWPSVAASYATSAGIAQYDPVRCFGPSYSTGSIQGSMNAISANSKYKNEALKFLQLVNSDTKLRDILHYGIEGKHFSYVNNGTAVKRLRTDWPLVNYQEGTFFIETPEDTVPPGYWDEVRRQNEEAVPSVLLGFMMDLEPVQMELTNCRTVYEKYSNDLLVGASDPAVILPQVIDELKASGFDKIIAEAQRQVDEFMKR